MIKNGSGLIERIKAVAGQDFDSYGCRVRNPHITARQSIEIADYIVELEQERNELAAQVERLRTDVFEEIENRDISESAADSLANEIARFFGIDIGEHSSANSPLDNAFEVVPDTTLSALKAQWQAEIHEQYAAVARCDKPAQGQVMKTHKCSKADVCKSTACSHAILHEPKDCTGPAPCGAWPGNPDFKPTVICLSAQETANAKTSQ